MIRAKRCEAVGAEPGRLKNLPVAQPRFPDRDKALVLTQLGDCARGPEAANNHQVCMRPALGGSGAEGHWG